jgi:16S rRNA (cytosine967-C5)-methyltransferase
VYGTLRRYGSGDALLRRLVDRDPDTEIRALLLVALYRLDSRPDSEHVVVDQAVDAAGVLTNRKAGGFVNAVLRNFLRRRAELVRETARQPEVLHQHPAWWVRRLEAAWPEQWPGIVAADNAPPPVSLRINARRTSRDDYLARLQAAGVAASAVDGFASAIRLPEGARIDALPGFADGDFAVQDPGAQRAAEWLDLRDGQRVLDACAAPGGKAGHLLELAAIDLLALDVDAARCRRVEDNLKRLGHQARIVVGDAGRPAEWWDGQGFDRILADVPCTASGVVRRHPDVKWLRQENDLRKFARTQAALLRALWPLLKPGGKLLYATCAEARLLKQTQLLPGSQHDGFFYALLEKPLA